MNITTRCREPVKAYEILNRAIKAADNPPEFTREDFYKETESTGKSYALLGNIFYYYFDKVQMRYGDLEDEDDRNRRPTGWPTTRSRATSTRRHSRKGTSPPRCIITWAGSIT